MTKSLANINERLTTVESQTKELFQHFHQSYRHYIQFLDLALKHQLTLAVHQICTKLYPDEFLALSLTARSSFQSQLRQLSSQFQTKFISSLYSSGIPWQVEPNEPRALPESLGQESNFSWLSPDSLEMTSLIEDSAPITQPEELRVWCHQMEQSIHRVLDELSRATNQLLQDSHILSSHLPSEILEIAMQSDSQGMGISRDNSPHILSVLVETNPRSELDDSSADDDENENQESPPVTKLVGVHLRLMDLEFTDPQLGLMRKQLSQLSERLKKLHRHYYSLQRELRVVEAERAWQASWGLSDEDA